jgi:16S rRNA (cytidine1402-2'-O)-methyltransferase
MYDIDYSNKEFYALTSFTDKSKLNHYKNLITKNEVAMVSEAGTPGLSDPGKSLIQLCNENALPYTILPGANALVPAIVGAGFDTTIFTFLGFLPQKKGRQTALKKMISEETPTFFYESVHRIEKLISELREM